MSNERMIIDLQPNELIIDNFAGGGGASLGIEQALGRYIDIAINHDAEALAMHTANHPHTRHFIESVWDVDPKKFARVGRLASPGSHPTARTTQSLVARNLSTKKFVVLRGLWCAGRERLNPVSSH